MRRVAPLFEGLVANVSAGTDEDKEGGRYRDYFINASTYELTNYGPGTFRGFQGRPGEHLLDLEGELPETLKGRFDCVFNHTTLEHVFRVDVAFANLCALTKDVALIVVPFVQVQHESDSYRDYWRFTPTCCRRLFAENGLTVVYESANNDFNAATYLFFVASRHSAKWRDRLPSYSPISEAANWIGAPQPRLIDRCVRVARRLGMRAPA